MDETTPTTTTAEHPSDEALDMARQKQVDASFQGINIGGHTVTASTEHLDEEQRVLVRWLHHYARQERWTWEDLTRHVGFSSTTWSRIWNDKYRYPKADRRAGERIPIDEQCAAIARVKKLVEEREAVTKTDFVETTVWQRVNWLCRRAFVRSKIGFIFGESQIGKTTALREYARRNNHGQTIYAEMPPASGVQLMLRKIAEALNVPSRAGFDSVLQDVCRALDSSRCLVLDEMQRVFTTYQKGSVMRCLDTIRYIHDQTGCGLVLCGTIVVRDQLDRGEFAQYLKQLKRRGRTLMLALPTAPPREDLDAMAAAFGLRPASGEAEQTLMHVAKTDGFGAVKMLLQDASERASKKRRPVTWDDFNHCFSIAERMAETPEN